jgi:uncharacterized protein DUF4389
MASIAPSYPAQLTIDYPIAPRDRVSVGLRIFFVIPIAIVLATVGGGGVGSTRATAAGGGGIVFLGTVLMLLFRQRYPRWWFDWNYNLVRFSTRVASYLLLLGDEYPSTEDEQAVHIALPDPQGGAAVNRYLPLVKWFLAIPHYIILFFLGIATVLVTIVTWFAILFTGRHPESLHHFVVGVLRWGVRVEAYAFVLVTDQYPPFRLDP